MNATWESILDQFLTGEGSRADVESLRLRVGLGAEEREEVESALRLVDELAAAGDTIVMQDGALERLSVRLSEHVARETTMPRWEWDGSGYRADPLILRPAPLMDDEEIANAIIEGRSAPASFPRRVTGDRSNESNRHLEEFQRIIDTLSDPGARPSIPPGAEERLAASLRGHMDAEAEEMDPSIAKRILHQLKSCPLPSLFSENVPDVLAATTDGDQESTASETPEDKPQR